MSSMPFKLGLPVVDKLPLISGHYVLRAKDRQHMYKIIRATQAALDDTATILVYEIEYRPDHPVPVRTWFAEVKIVMDPVEEKDVFLWKPYPGKTKATMIY